MCRVGTTALIRKLAIVAPYYPEAGAVPEYQLASEGSEEGTGVPAGKDGHVHRRASGDADIDRCTRWDR